MDGVVYHGEQLLPGVSKFVDWLKANDKRFIFLTNASDRTPQQLQQKLARMGIQLQASRFYTAALATAEFLSNNHPGASAFIIGDQGLQNALRDAGISANENNPDFVIVGETRSYSFDIIEHAVNLVQRGARIIGTCPDLKIQEGERIVPGVGALVAPIELATGCKTYFMGKPNPLMVGQALKKLNCNRNETVIIGDNMSTDIIAGIESELDTVLVLSGVTNRRDLRKFAYHPRYVLENIGEILS